MIRILVVDDHPVVREGVIAILSDQPDLRVVAEASSGEEALEALEGVGADVAVVDMRLPGMNGLDVCRNLRRRCPRVSSVIFTSFPTYTLLADALEAGAKGVVVKESGGTVLREAVRVTAGGATYIDPALSARFATVSAGGRRVRGPFGLTLQEMRVLEMLTYGLTNSEIGDRLSVGEATVKTHLRAAMRKLRVANRAQAAAVAQRIGLA